MTVTIPIRAIELTPGSTISIHNLSWQDFQQILSELGEQTNNSKGLAVPRRSPGSPAGYASPLPGPSRASTTSASLSTRVLLGTPPIRFL